MTTLAATDFHTDNTHGKKGERIAAAWAQQQFPEAHIEFPPNNFQDHDLKIEYMENATPIKVEVKYERYTHDTPNICIEYGRRKQNEQTVEPHSWSTTTAHFFLNIHDHATKPDTYVIYLHSPQDPQHRAYINEIIVDDSYRNISQDTSYGNTVMSALINKQHATAMGVLQTFQYTGEMA